MQSAKFNNLQTLQYSLNCKGLINQSSHFPEFREKSRSLEHN